MRKLCRVLFSRYTVSLVILLADVAWIVLFLSYLSSFWPAFAAVLIVLDVFLILHLVNRDTSPENKLPWAVIMLTVPFLGGVLYALFFSRKLSRRERKHLACLAAFCPDVSEKTAELSALAAFDDAAAGKAMAILTEDPLSVVYRGTQAQYFGDGADMFAAMLSDIRAAERFIFLETFILEEGVMWTALHAALLEKVRKGVEVRLLYDDIGCMQTLPADYDKRLRAEGIDAYRFSPVTPRMTVAHNHRDHRKITVIDGRIAYTGGINVADEYIHACQRFGHWKDGGIRLCGDAAHGLTRLFLNTFDLATKRVSDPTYYKPDGAVGTRTPSDGGFYLPFGSGPRPLYSYSVGKNAILNIVAQAKRYVYVTTPYLIMDYELTMAFTSAARRGVDVRIITPHIPDKRMIFLLTRSAYPTLLSSGVRVFEYTPGFIHEKLLVADDEYTVIGTVNLDFRSFAHHFEDAVWTYHSPLLQDARDSFMQAESLSQEIKLADARLGLFGRILRSLIRLFSPLL